MRQRQVACVLRAWSIMRAGRGGMQPHVALILHRACNILYNASSKRCDGRGRDRLREVSSAAPIVCRALPPCLYMYLVD